MSKPKSIAVGIPNNGTMRVGTGCALAANSVSLQRAGYSVFLTARGGPYVGWNRDGLFQDAVDADAEWMMMIDTDVVFPNDAILRLLTRGKDLIGGLYMTKSIPSIHTIKLGTFDPVKNEYDGAMEGFEPPAEPFRVSAVPTGFLLARVAAFADVPRPLFPMIHPIGEDIAFCQKAEAAGIEVWCDPTFPIEHLGDFAY